MNPEAFFDILQVGCYREQAALSAKGAQMGDGVARAGVASWDGENVGQVANLSYIKPTVSEQHGERVEESSTLVLRRDLESRRPLDL
jgi:hypothetical protein